MVGHALVTGSAGLVGRHMVRRLVMDRWHVVGLDIAEGAQNDCRKWFRSSNDQFDLIVHGAYHVGGRVAIDGINTNFARNLELDAAMFEWAIRTQQKRVLYFSSSAAYPIRYQTQEWMTPGTVMRRKGLRETQICLDDPELPDAGYGWAKLTGEMLAEQARRAGVPVTVVRPFSGYAEDQTLDYPFPAIVKRAMAGDYTVWGPKGQTRDWIHMDDVVEACMRIVEAGHDGPVNLCSGIGVEMGDLMKKVARGLHMEDPVKYPHGNDIVVRYLPGKPTGVFYRVGNPALMNTFHTPAVNIMEGIRRAITKIS